MSSSKFRKAIGAVKDHTSISLAKADLDVAIVKATSHEDYPAEDRQIKEVLNLSCDSPLYVASCVTSISRRLSKTRNWIVALKLLILVQRLLHEGGPAYEHEIFFATRRGTRLLNMSDFRDLSRSNTWDYSAFIRTYALFLDEELENRVQGRRRRRKRQHDPRHEQQQQEEQEKEEEEKEETPLCEMKNEEIFSRIHHLMQLLERFLACRPAGGAKHDRIVLVALCPIVKQSFELYEDITDMTRVLVDRLCELNVTQSQKVLTIFCRVSKQFDELDMFYDWCKSVRILTTSEYPEIHKISHRKLHILDDYIKDKSNNKFEESKTETKKKKQDIADLLNSEEEDGHTCGCPKQRLLLAEEQMTWQNCH